MKNDSGRYAGTDATEGEGKGSGRSGTTLLDQIYRKYWQEVRDYIHARFGAGPPDPEDVAQQSFTAFARVENPTAVKNPRAYLYRSAINMVLNYRRGEAVRQRHVLDEQHQEQFSGTQSDGISPEGVLLSKEQLTIVIDTLKKMPLRRRRFLLLNRVEGLTYAEISRQTDVSEPTVRREVARAIKECAAAGGAPAFFKMQDLVKRK